MEKLLKLANMPSSFLDGDGAGAGAAGAEKSRSVRLIPLFASGFSGDAKEKDDALGSLGFEPENPNEINRPASLARLLPGENMKPSSSGCAEGSGAVANRFTSASALADAGAAGACLDRAFCFCGRVFVAAGGLAAFCFALSMVILETFIKIEVVEIRGACADSLFRSSQTNLTACLILYLKRNKKYSPAFGCSGKHFFIFATVGV